MSIDPATIECPMCGHLAKDCPCDFDPYSDVCLDCGDCCLPCSCDSQPHLQ